jgi:mutator protein MutT
METKLVEVAAGLIFRDGKLLITQRHADSHLGGLWEFPGGKRELDESFEHCLERELMEELGICVRVGELFESVTHSYPEKSVHLKFFLCKIESGEPKALGCAAVKWINKAELKDYEFPAADLRLLENLRISNLWSCS